MDGLNAAWSGSRDLLLIFGTSSYLGTALGTSTFIHILTVYEV